MNLKTNKVIFGTACDADPRKGIEQHGHALETLRRAGIPFLEVRLQQGGGVIDGVLLEATDVQTHSRNFGVAIEFARMFKREFVFEAHNDDTCVTYDLRQGLNPHDRGRIREATRDEVIKYRKVAICEPCSGRYFVVDWEARNE